MLKTCSSKLFIEICGLPVSGISNEKGLDILNSQLKKLETKITENNRYNEK